MINLNTNLSSLITQRSLATSTQRLNQAIEQMTTGFKINHAKDNAANYNITTNMTTKIGAYMVAEDNCAMGLDLLATANGSLDQISDKLQRLRALAVQVSNGTYGEQSKQAINQEANAIVDEIERIYNMTEYNGINLLDDSKVASSFINSITRRDTSTMTTLDSVDENADLADGVYSISTAEELAKLARMTEQGLVSTGDEFVLANDIDLKTYLASNEWLPIGTKMNGVSSFKGVFDGNGFVISNLRSINSSCWYMGLFGATMDSTIKNLGLDNIFVLKDSYAGSFVGLMRRGIIENCFVSGCLAGDHNIGGIVAEAQQGTILDTISNVSLCAKETVGGISGTVSMGNLLVDGCVSDCEIIASSKAGGFVGASFYSCFISNSQLFGESSYLTGSFVGFFSEKYSVNLNIDNCEYSSFYENLRLDFTPDKSNVTVNINGVNSIQIPKDVLKQVSLQIGINADASSQISLDLGLIEKNFDLMRGVCYTPVATIEVLDCMLENMSSKQVEYGSVQNRLESALEEISVQYENLVSSRSTLRDADISEVSSEYIRQQILQQASATLMATANQSPSIALQLI